MKQKYLDILGINSEDELDNIDWKYISAYQKLSEDFIREFKDKVYWDYISKYQTLSEDFMIEFSYYLTYSHELIRGVLLAKF